MTNNTHALGKDASYEETISRMSDLLKQHSFEIEEVSWQNPVPGVWSVHIRDRNCPQLFSNGKGHSKNAALASALGEFHERLACDYFFSEFSYEQAISESEFVHAPNEKWFAIDDTFALSDILPKSLAAFYDPEQALTGVDLVDFNSANVDRGICTLPFVRISDNSDVSFPINILNNLYVSNGMAAGNTIHEARVQALSEIIERYAKNRIISECISMPDIPQVVLDKYPGITAGIEALEKQGFRILVKDASLGKGLPVVNVTLLNPKDSGVFAAFGAHPMFEVALERTLTELLQGRSLDKLEAFPPPSLDPEEVSNPYNLEMHFIDSTGVVHLKHLCGTPDYEFRPWDFDEATDKQYEYLTSAIHGMGKDIFVADYNHFGVYCCRVVVPGMSEIYPIEDLSEANRGVSVPARRSILSPQALDAVSGKALYEFVEEMSFPREQPVSHLVGILPAEDSLWADLCVGEFNALLCLVSKDVENAIMWSEWCSTSSLLAPERQKRYRCIYLLLRTTYESSSDAVSYHASLKKLFGESLFSTAISLISGQGVLDDLEDFTTEDINVPHAKLLDAYRKCQKAKAQQI